MQCKMIRSLVTLWLNTHFYVISVPSYLSIPDDSGAMLIFLLSFYSSLLCRVFLAGVVLKLETKYYRYSHHHHHSILVHFNWQPSNTQRFYDKTFLALKSLDSSQSLESCNYITTALEVWTRTNPFWRI